MVTYTVNNVPGVSSGTGALLSYRLEPVEKALVFQVTEQSPLVTKFLQKQNFQASNGLVIKSSEYPEYRESELTIYLRGNNWMKNGKLDSTHFYSNKVRDDRAARIRQALKELVSTVKKTSSYCFPMPQRQPKVAWNCEPIFVF